MHHRYPAPTVFGMKSGLCKALVCILTVSWVAPAIGNDATNATKTTSKDKAFWKSVYEKHHVVELDLSITKDAWESMQPTRNERGGRGQRGAKSEFNYAKASLSVDGVFYQDVGLRFKGNSSYRFSARGFKRPFKIDTNRFVKGLKLHGRTKLNLSNSYLDSSYMKEKLAYELYEAAGIPTPGVGWASVSLTIEGLLEKKELGIYVLIEQVDKHFLEEAFGKKSRKSLLMKPELPSNWEYPGDDPDLYESFDIKEGEENIAQIRGFGEFLKLLHHASDEAFSKAIGERMDLEQFAGYLAVTSLLANIDSFVGLPHNYYLLVDQADGKVRLLPWDLNESFGTFTLGNTPEALVNWDIDRPWVAGIRLVERLFATEAFPKIYKIKLTELMKDSFTEKQIFERIAVIEKAIAPYAGKAEEGPGEDELHMAVSGDSTGFDRSAERQILAIKPFVRRRIASIKAQLAGTIEGQRLETRGGPGGKPGRGGPPGSPPRLGGRPGPPGNPSWGRPPEGHGEPVPHSAPQDSDLERTSESINVR